MDNDLAWMDATAQAELVRRGDVTPAELITAIVTEVGVHRPPFVQSLAGTAPGGNGARLRRAADAAGQGREA